MLAKSLHGVPQVLLHNLEHNHVLHQRMIVLTIVTKDEPHFREARRLKVRVSDEARDFFRVKMYFGFMDQQDVRRALQLLSNEGQVIAERRLFLRRLRENFVSQ
jgi:KUP system potassium uptake protein